MKNYYFILFSFFALCMGSCSGFDRINDALDLKNEIAEKYDSDKVEVKITNKEDISIALIDDELSDLTQQEKREIAAEIGKMALEMQPEGFETGKVLFVNEMDAGVVSRSSSETFDMF